MKAYLFTILCCFGLVAANAQEFEIKGFAPAFVGEKVSLYTYQDYVTMTKIKLGEGEVAAEDSTFHISLDNGATFKGIIEVGKTEAPIYLAPKTTYEIYFPAAENQAISFQNQRTDIMFFALDTSDINYRILQYNQWFDSFVYYHEEDIAKGQFLTYLDTFMTYASDAYAHVKDEYFLTYVRYNVAEMKQTFGGNKKSQKRLETFLSFVEPFPVYYENDQYMKFFKGFYGKNFDDYQPTIEAEINMAIYNSSPTKLMSVLKQDLFLSNPEVRELVMIDQLGKQYYKRDDQKRNIIIMLDSLESHAKYQVNATVAKNVKDFLTSLEPGFPAPIIQLKDSLNDDAITWMNYQGKFVYFNFFETWNEKAKVEMKIINDLRKDYGEFISFLSVCTDKEKATYDKFRADNPEMDWDIFYVGHDSDLKEDYKVSGVSTYYLIDQSGFIALAPAPSPSPDGEYESIDKTFFYIKEAMTPSERKRIGEP